ncbi:MAG: ATP-binding protein [Pseudomonadota bacterium]
MDRRETDKQATEKDLPSLIRETALEVRKRDFLWAMAIAAGVLIVVEVSGAARNAWLAPAAWVAFVGSLLLRYRLSAARAWAEPVQRVVETELRSQAAELESLRLVRGVAKSLPEPLFILDASGVVELANVAAEEFVNLEWLEDRHFTSVLRASSVYEAFQEVAAGAQSRIVDFTATGAVERHCRAFVAPLKESDHDRRAPDRVMIYIRDLTSERRVERMRVDFIAAASHELRTPLASLLGFIETLRGHAKTDPEAQEKFLAIMQGQAERMQRLVSDLMSLSRIELKEHVRPRAEIDLCRVAQEVIEGSAPLFEAQGARVVFACSEADGVVVEGDRDQLLQAVQNLVDNAVRYGGDEPRIEVRVGNGPAPALDALAPQAAVSDEAARDADASDEELDANRIGDAIEQFAARNNLPLQQVRYVQVRDNGAGIPRAALPRLTERFYRVSVEDSKKSGGTGLGLAIVKHILNRHKAGLFVESAVGRGSAFTCYFLPPKSLTAGDASIAAGAASEAPAGGRDSAAAQMASAEGRLDF